MCVLLENLKELAELYYIEHQALPVQTDVHLNLNRTNIYRKAKSNVAEKYDYCLRYVATKLKVAKRSDGDLTGWKTGIVFRSELYYLKVKVWGAVQSHYEETNSKPVSFKDVQWYSTLTF